MSYLKGSDFLAAAAPTIGTMTLSEWNSLGGILGTLIGLAYLAWKWQREARAK